MPNQASPVEQLRDTVVNSDTQDVLDNSGIIHVYPADSQNFDESDSKMNDTVKSFSNPEVSTNKLKSKVA